VSSGSQVLRTSRVVVTQQGCVTPENVAIVLYRSPEVVLVHVGLSTKGAEIDAHCGNELIVSLSNGANPVLDDDYDSWTAFVVDAADESYTIWSAEVVSDAVHITYRKTGELIENT